MYLRAATTVLPSSALSVHEVLTQERDRYERQLGALSEAVRARLEPNLGIEALPNHVGPPSALALSVVQRALDEASLPPSSVSALLDYSTMPADHPAVWGLPNRVQGELGLDRAAPFAVHGSGCAGFHLALRVAEAWLTKHTGTAVLFGCDCVPSGSRCSLPISLMGDAASALVVSTEPPRSGPRVALRAIQTVTLGEFHDLVRAEGCPIRIEVDAAAFEQRILPLHFLMCQRVLTRACAAANISRDTITHLVYPNTTALDRTSVIRALGLSSAELSGPGPKSLGHAFANDMVLNLPELSSLQSGSTVALLSVGSGFTWAAAVLHVSPSA